MSPLRDTLPDKNALSGSNKPLRMTPSIRGRFVFTIGANLLRSSLSFVSGMLLARWLGPASYGNMAFLVGTFLSLRQFLDLGSSSAFFTFLSQRSRSKRFVRSFFVWLAGQFLVPLCVIGLLFPSRWIASIWQGQPRNLVLLAFTAAFMQNSMWPVIQQAGESQRRTLWVQGIGIAVAVLHLLAVILLWRLGTLGLYAVFAVIALEYALAAVVAHHRFQYTPIESEPEPGFRKYLNYCFPLISYSCVAFVYMFTDDWLLQAYGGGVQQAFYAVGAQFSAIALIATSSILNIFWKEIAEAHHRGDHQRASSLYQKVSRLLFLVGATIAGFLMPWSGSLLRFVLGTAYVGGATTMAIMFLYPVHQSMGQIGSTMLYATERISLQVTIGIGFMIASMGVTYLVLAPRNAVVPGLGLASEGLAIKMVVMQLIQVNIIAYAISRIWKRPFDWIYQPVSMLGCISLGWLAQFTVANLAVRAWPLPVRMGLAGLLYLPLMAIFVYAMPWLTGFSRAELVWDAWHVFQKSDRRLQAFGATSRASSP